MDTKFLIGHNWFWRDLENKTSTSDFRFYTNSTIIKTVYTTDNLTIQALGSEKDGSGADLMLFTLQTKDSQPELKLEEKVYHTPMTPRQKSLVSM